MDGLDMILVTPEQLIQMADEWELLIKSAKEAYKAIGEIAKQTKIYFRGSTAEVFEKEVEKRLKDGMEKADSMQELVVKLTHIAEEYRNTEGENQNVISRS